MSGDEMSGDEKSGDEMSPNQFRWVGVEGPFPGKSKDHSSLCEGCSVTECAAGSLRGPSVFKTLCVHKML